MDETWLPVREFPKHYEISNLGRLRRVKPYNGNGRGHIRKPHIAKNGYVVYLLSIDQAVFLRSAHRMVADAFIGPIPAGMQVNHIDGNKANPAVDNLEIVTNSENRSHSYRVLGVKPNKAVENNVNAKLDWGKVDAIRAEYAAGGTSHSKLARKYNVNRMTILRVLLKRAWRDEDRPSTPS